VILRNLMAGGLALAAAYLWAMLPAAAEPVPSPVEIAQAAPVAETDLQKALRAGGVRLKAAEIRALLWGATYSHRRPADGAVGFTYIGQDGSWRSKNKLPNGQITSSAGVAVIANDAVCFIAASALAAKPACPSKDVRLRAVVRSGTEIGYYFLDVGTVAVISTETRRGNPENL
jgi:hypothetical protein